MSTSTSQTKDFWAIAIGKVTDEDKAQLNVYRTDKVAVLDDILSLVREKQKVCLQKRWVLKKRSGETLVVRDLVDKIAVWVGKFVKVGDVAVQYDTTHAALPWAAVRFLLQIALSDAQTFGAMAEGVETVSRLISRYAMFEAAYLHRSGHTLSLAQQKLSEALIVLYATILTYLAKAGKYFQQSSPQRLAGSIVKPADTVQIRLELITKEGMVVDKLANIVHAEMTSALTKTITSLQDDNTRRFDDLEKLMKAFDEPLVRTVGTLQDLQDHLKAEERRGLLTWLSRIPCRNHHELIYREVLSDTGLWLLNKADFVKWQSSSSSSLLWLHGIPGAGKSTLTAIVIQRLLDDAAGVENSAPLAYFYCSGQKSESCRMDPTEILRAILKQLSSLGPDGRVRHAIATEYKQRRHDAERDGLNVRDLSFSECTQLIHELTSEAPATVVIDGIDELGDSSQDLLDALQYLVEASSSILKVFVSSRDEASIARSLRHARSIRVTSADNSKDIAAFVKHHVSKAVGQKRLLGGRVSASLQEVITTKIIDGAGEMFLWASLQLQHLCSGRVFKLEEDVVAALEKPPPTLEQILDSVYKSINESGDEAKGIAKQVFAFLLVARAPVFASDMMASLIKRSSSVRNDAKNSVLSVDIVLDVCCNLLMFDDNRMIFRFIHSSVPEYLERRPEFTSSNTHHLAFQRCLEFYIESPTGVELPCEKSQLSEDVQMDMRTYAASFWAVHYSKINNPAIQAASDSLLLSFAFDHDGTCFQEWLEDAKYLTQSLPPWDLRLRDLTAVQSPSRSPLLAASLYGLLSILEYMHSRALAHGRKIDLNEKNIDGASAIYVSARYGNVATLNFLIVHDCFVDPAGGHYGNPLQAAAFHGHVEALQILLDHGADPFAAGKFEDVCQAAIAGGHEDLIQRLLSREDITSRCNLKAAFMNLCYAGNHSAVNFLLNRDNLKQAVSEPDGVSYKPVYQALQLALYRGRASVAKNLLAQCEDVNATGGHFGNLIQAAAFGGHETMVRWLTDRGADVHACGRYGSPLRAASLGGHNAVVQLLLDRGARMDMKENNALQAAALNGHLMTSKLLISHSNEACNWHACYESALQAASFKGHLEIVQLLLQDVPNESEVAGQGAMLAAVVTGQESIVSLLIKRLPRLREMGREFMVSCSMPGEVDLLPPPRDTPRNEPSSSIKGEGADNASIRPSDSMEDPFDWDSLTKPADMQQKVAIPATDTPLGQEYLLRYAAGQGNKRMIEHLMACGFELNEKDNVNRNLSHQPTALEVAALRSDLDIVALLLKKGAILGKALHFAVRDGSLDVVSTLLAYKPDAELDLFVGLHEIQEFEKPPVPSLYKRPDSYKQPGALRIMSNRSLLAIAVEWRHDEMILVLLRHKVKSSHPELGLSMIVAAHNGCDKTIRVFLEYGRATDGSLDTTLISDVLLQQSVREAIRNGHLQTVKLLLEHCSLDDKQSHCICIAMSEARTHDQNEVMAYLQVLAQKLDKTRFMGDQLLTRASERGAYDFRTRTFGSSTHHLENPFGHPNREKSDSKVCVNSQLEELKGALKAGQYESARLLLGKDTSCSILVTETEILHFAICTMWINDFYKRPKVLARDTSVHGDLIEILIKHGAPTGAYDCVGHTPLFYACSKPIPGVFDILIRFKANPWTEHTSILGDSPELFAPSFEHTNAKKFNLLSVALTSRLDHEDNFDAHRERENIILSLLDLGLQIDPNDADLIIFLHVACSTGNLECVQKLANGKANIHAGGRSQENYYRLGTAVHAAVIGAQVKVLQYLLEVGVNVHQKAVYQDPYNRKRLANETAIQLAFRTTLYDHSTTRWDVLEILLEVWDGTDDCTTVLHAAIRHGKAELVDSLLRRSIGPPDLSKIPQHELYEDERTIKLIIDRGILAYVPSEMMKDWHEHLVFSKSISSLKLLLRESGPLLPNPLSDLFIFTDVFPDHGEGGSSAMVRFLLEHYGSTRRDINATFGPGLLRTYYTGGDDTNTLIEACRCSRSDNTIKILLEYGADPDCPGLADAVLARLFNARKFHRGRENIYYRHQIPDQTRIRLLLDYGADINGSKTSPEEAEKYPRTLQPPLFRAVEDEKLPMLQFLVSNGADVNATSGPETPLHLARRLGFDDIAEYLVRHGAIDRHDPREMGRSICERPGLTPVTTESLTGYGSKDI